MDSTTYRLAYHFMKYNEMRNSVFKEFLENQDKSHKTASRHKKMIEDDLGYC